MVEMMKRLRVIFLAGCFLGMPLMLRAQPDTLRLAVDFSGEGKTLQNYWRGSGFTPGSQLLNKDMQMTLDYLASIPHDGIRYLRPHWLLNMVQVKDPYGANPDYDFSRLYHALDEMVLRGLRPIFEIMGYPRLDGEHPRATRRQGALRWVPDFQQEEDIRRWYVFIQELIRGLEERYGSDEIAGWYFECTNEPDGDEQFWDQGIAALLNYWDATSEAIRSVNPDYVFGGPGNARHLSDTFKAVLAHCESGTNAITGETGAVLDFISVHSKALPYEMIRRERQAFDYIRESHPQFAQLPFWNNEADPTWGWGKPLWWRPTPWYAAFVVQSVDAHNRLLIDRAPINYGLLVNDHNFLGGWYERTLCARRARQDDPDCFWLVPKPVFHGMNLLAYAEGRRYAVEGYATGADPVVLMAVRRDNGQIILLAANMPDFGNPRQQAEDGPEVVAQQRARHDAAGAQLEIMLSGMGFSEPHYTHVRIDEAHGNAYQAWNALGRPDTLERDAYDALIEQGTPVVVDSRVKLEAQRLSLAMPPSAVSLIVISEGAVSGGLPAPDVLRVTPYCGYDGSRKDFVRWQQVSDGVAAYHLLVSHDGEAYRQVTQAPVFALGYVYVWPQGVDAVTYRVEAQEL